MPVQEQFYMNLTNKKNFKRSNEDVKYMKKCHSINFNKIRMNRLIKHNGMYKSDLNYF